MDIQGSLKKKYVYIKDLNECINLGNKMLCVYQIWSKLVF